MGGGVFPIPKTQNQKKVPLNHPKITQKNKLNFTQNHPKNIILNEAFPKGGVGGPTFGKNSQIMPYFFLKASPIRSPR